MDGLADLVDGDSGGGGDDEFVEKVAGVGSDDGGSKDVSVGSGDDLDEPGGFVYGTDPGDTAELLGADTGLVIPIVCTADGSRRFRW